jgi:hypothetical protein
MASSKPVSGLFSLPTELLDSLTQTLSWKHIGRLLLIGNKTLTAILYRPGVVTQLDVSVDTDVSVDVAKWPQLFESFRHLRKLSASAADSYRSHMTGLKIETLPSTITELQIHWKNIHSDLEKQYSSKSFFNVAELFPMLTKLQLRVHLTEENAEWAKTFPASLTFLEVGRWHSDYPLPDSVTHLSFQERSRIESDICLPSQLRYLRFCDEVDGELPLLLASLPPNLEQLIFTSQVTKFPNAYFAFIPRDLRILKVLIRHPSPDLNDIELPPSLTEVQIPLPTTLPQLKSLPKTLTTMRLDDFPTAPKFGLREFFVALPPGIRSLNLNNTRSSERISIEGPLEIPASLTKFDCDFLDVDQAAISSFPPTLTSLSLGVVSSTIEIPFWPSMRSLSAKFMSLMPNVLARVSSSLVTLRLSSSIWSDPVTGGERLLDLSPIKRREEHMQQLPSFPFQFRHGFEKLDADTCDYIGDEILAKLPNTLTYLSIASALYVTDEGAKFLKPCSSLITLDISKAPITGEAFQYFPNTLRFLEASSAKEVYDRHIKHLPRSLLYIYMSGAKYLTDACGPSIPPRATTFRVETNEFITMSIIPTLPPVLRGKSSTFVTKNFRIDSGKDPVSTV